jgi:hypothetical protein
LKEDQKFCTGHQLLDQPKSVKVIALRTEFPMNVQALDPTHLFLDDFAVVLTSMPAQLWSPIGNCVLFREE